MADDLAACRGLVVVLPNRLCQSSKRNANEQGLPKSEVESFFRAVMEFAGDDFDLRGASSDLVREFANRMTLLGRQEIDDRNTSREEWNDDADEAKPIMIRAVHRPCHGSGVSV